MKHVLIPFIFLLSLPAIADDSLARCQMNSAEARVFAEQRDNGKPLSELLTNLRKSSKLDGETEEQFRITAKFAAMIYSRPDLKPETLEAVVLERCLTRF